jgi:hypothetical protein
MDYPEFTPNLTPRQIFELGSFGGTYYRPIYSSVVKRNLRDVHRKRPSLRGVPEYLLASTEYRTKLNKYGVKSGSGLEEWEAKGWITAHNPYGWMDWYVQFHEGKRNAVEDRRQIDRWLALAGPRGRFRTALINKIRKAGARWDDPSISPRIRQTLQHWGYAVTPEDIT